MDFEQGDASGMGEVGRRTGVSGSNGRTGEGARILKDKVEETMSIAENGSAPTDIMDRLDLLLMNLTEKSGIISAQTRSVLITIRNAGCGEYNYNDPGLARTG